jgi:hypothetical protein
VSEEAYQRLRQLRHGVSEGQLRAVQRRMSDCCETDTIEMLHGFKLLCSQLTVDAKVSAIARPKQSVRDQFGLGTGVGPFNCFT